MGSKGSSSSSFSPPPEVVEAYREALGYGRAAMGQQYAPYTGEITAPLTPTQESGIYNVNRAVGTAIPYFGQATGLTADVAGRTITPQQFSQQAIQEYMSPYTSAVANSTFANLREQQKQEQEGLQTGAIRAGAFGGDRAGIASANMARQQDLATAQAMSNIYNQGYGQAVGLFGQQQGINLAADQANAMRQLQAAQQLAGLGTGLQSSVLQGAQAQLAAGAQQQAVQQAINSGYYNQYLAAQAYPYQQAQFFANLATGVGGQMGGTTTGTPAQPSPAGSIFGALGALGSIFSASDKRVKENIKPIGKTNDGQTIYRYNFKGDPATQIGLIAQEVEKKHPEAVRTINGVKGVDYKEATDDSVRSMGGGVVPSSTRHNFAAGGPSINEEEDPMIPYKAGVPSKVLQIPKLAKIGGTKPNFGGTPPGPVQGPSSQDFKGAAEGLGKLAKKYDLFGSKETTPDADSAISGISDWLKANGGVVRPRFENGGVSPKNDRFSDLSSDIQREPLDYRKLIESGALRVTQPGTTSGSPIGDSDPESYSLVTKWNDDRPNSETRAWDNKPESYEAAIRDLENAPLSGPEGPLYDGKYLQILESAKKLGLTDFVRNLENKNRRRFENGEEVPVTADTKTLAFNPDRDRADIVRPSYDPDVDRVEPMRVASLGDVARSVDAGVPSSEPVREAARPQGGVVPSIARSNTDLPPLFQAAAEAVAQEPEEKQPVSVPSMARADTNVQPVQPGVAPSQVVRPQQVAQPATLTNKERDDLIRTMIGEAGREPYEGQLAVANVIRNRQLSGRYGKSVSDIVYAPKQFSVWNAGDPAGDMARRVSADSSIYKRMGDIVDRVWGGEATDPTKGATHFANVDRVREMRNGNLQPWLQGMIDSGQAIKIGNHTFGQADAGAYQPRGEGEAGLGAGKRVQVASADGKTATDANKNWPGFGMAGEGKRSIIESIMDRDFDPIQKRALFSFFAGMAASPSPWFGQQLGAGMAAASNVYNESMNKQADLDIRKQQLGMEQQKIGIQEQLANVQEKTKAIEALKFWQSRFKQIPTAEGFSYLDTTTGQTISQDEYNSQMATVMKQLKISPTETGTAAPKPGLAPTAPAGAAPAPSGGVAPQPKPEVAAPKPAVEEPKAPAAPAPVEVPKPTTAAPQKTAAVEAKETPASQSAEADMYKDVRDDYNPIVLRAKADEQRKIAANAQKLGDLAGAKNANDTADSYSKKAVEITENKIPVIFKDGRVGRLPAIEQEALRTESAKESQKINVEQNTKWMNEQADAQVRRDLLMSRTNELAKILETYETGRFAEQKANLVASLRAIGINVPPTDSANAEKFEQFVKNQINNVFDEVKAIGGQVRVAEIQGLQQAQAGPGMQPEANRAILGYTRGVLNWENKKFDDSVDAIRDQGINRFNRAEWMRGWSKQNSLDNYIKDGKKSVAAMGATPQDAADLEEGQHYILKKGQFGVDRDGKYVFKTRQKDGVAEGAMVPVR